MYRAILNASVGIAILAFSAPSLAQTESGGGGVEEIVVTAQKRAQRLSDVPVTVSASSGIQLQQAGVTNVNQIGRIAPSFTVAASVYGYQVFSIRGINFNSQQLSAAPAVSAYLDEAVLPYTAMTGGLLLDVERVEVLKGPQGTLYGQNATAGSINVIAAKPTQVLSAGARVEVNNYGQTMVEGFVSGPVTDTLRMRLAATTTQGGEWQRGYYISPVKNGDQDKVAARLLVDWTPTDRFHLQLNVNGNYDHGEVIQPQLALVAPAIPGLEQPGLIGYPPATRNRDAEITPGFDTHAHNRLIQEVLRMDYEINDNMQLTSITNYADFRLRTPLDYDAMALDNQFAVTFGKVSTINQEVRLSGKALNEKANYVFGINYSSDKIRDGQTSTLDHYTGTPPFSQYTVDYNLKNESKAIFGNVDYEILPKLTLTAGARYTMMKESISGCVYGNDAFNGLLGFISGAFRSIAGLGPVPAGYFGPNTCATINDDIPNVPNPNGPGLVPDNLPVFANRSQKEHNFSWRGAASYKLTPDSMVYVSVSRGYKSGVFPAQPNLVNSELAPVRQESVTSYEVGTKLAMFDRTMRLNVSGFHYEYKDKQFYTYFPLIIGGVSSFIVNIPKSSVNGFDADLSITPTNNLTLRGAVTYIQTKVEQLLRLQRPRCSGRCVGQGFQLRAAMVRYVRRRV